MRYLLSGSFFDSFVVSLYGFLYNQKKSTTLTCIQSLIFFYIKNAGNIDLRNRRMAP